MLAASPAAKAAAFALGALLLAVLAGLAHHEDERRLSAARATFDAARAAERGGGAAPAEALALYERAIAERGSWRLPWSSWRVVTHAHANAAALVLRLGPEAAGGAAAARAVEHAALALADDPHNFVALTAAADGWAQSGHYYTHALPYLARVDAAAGRPTPYIKDGEPTFLRATSASSLLPPLPPDAAPQHELPALQRFDTWLRGAGARFSPNVRISFDAKGDGSGLRGVVAASAVVHRELLLQIPLRCTLAGLSPDHTAAAAADIPHSRAPPHRLAKLFEGGLAAEGSTLAIALRPPTAMQLKRGRPSEENLQLILRLLAELGEPRSFYAPYIETLPSAFPELPLFWNTEEVDALRGTNLWLEQRSLDEELSQLFLELHHPLSPLCSILTGGGDNSPPGSWSGGEVLRVALGGEGGAPSPCSEGAFRWAWAVVTSRAFSPSILVPVQDLLNHVDGTMTQ